MNAKWYAEEVEEKAIANGIRNVITAFKIKDTGDH